MIDNYVKQGSVNVAFLALVKAGLWETEAHLASFGEINYEEVFRLAEEQSTVGLVAAGLEHVTDVRIPQNIALKFAGAALRIERQNEGMNAFICELLEKFREHSIFSVIVKGQGIAQCYLRPLWRSCGDIDLLLTEDGFLKARELLRPLAKDGFYPDNDKARNIEATLSSWAVELHANQFCGLSRMMDDVIREVQDCIFYEGEVRTWMNGLSPVILPDPNCDVIIVFTHYLKHFYKGGLGLRPICDWCRLLWTFREDIDGGLLESRLRRMGLMTEWKAFGTFAVDYLGMPVDAMPLYDGGKKWKRKASRICSFVMAVGNMGHNRDMSYMRRYHYVIRKFVSFWRRCVDSASHAMIFPMDSMMFFSRIVLGGLKASVRGE